MIRRLSFPEGGRRYLSEVPGADPADAAGGQTGYRGDAAPREAVALPHALYLLGRFRLTPLRRPRGLPVALTRSSPASVLSQAGSSSISAKTMARCSIARPRALSWSMDSRRLTTSTWLFLNQPSSSSTSVSDRPRRSSAATFMQWPGGGRPSGDSALPVPGGPAAHVLEDPLAVGQRLALGLRVVGLGVGGHRHSGVSIGFPAHLSLAPGSGTTA